MPQPAGLPCAGCRGHRLHYYPTRELKDGRKVRVKVCSACNLTEPVSPADTPGLCCQRCGDVRLRVGRVSHPRPGVSHREKKCYHCGKVEKTVERRRLAAAV